MPASNAVIFVHFVWATWDRQPLITQNLKPLVFSTIRTEAKRLGCVVVAADGVADHVHLLLQMPATLSVADAAKHIKGASSFVVNKANLSPVHFKWQGSYSAFSVSRWDVRKVIHYIVHQEEHHQNGKVKRQFELSDDLASR